MDTFLTRQPRMKAQTASFAQETLTGRSLRSCLPSLVCSRHCYSEIRRATSPRSGNINNLLDTCSGKIHALLGRKVMTNLDSILKSRDITLPTKVHLVKAMVFPVVMYRCESWTIKKAECRRIDAFELWCWRRLLRVPWTARRSSQSIIKEISPGCSLVGLMVKLKFQYFGH